MGHPDHPPPQGSGGHWRRMSRKMVKARGQAGLERSSVFWRRSCTPELTAAMFACMPSAEDQASQHSSMAREGLHKSSPLTKELETAVGFWERESPYSLRVWPMASSSCSGRWSTLKKLWMQWDSMGYLTKRNMKLRWVGRWRWISEELEEGAGVNTINYIEILKELVSIVLKD